MQGPFRGTAVYTPQACDANQRIDDAADDCHLTAAEKSDTVKAEKAHAAPVQSTYDGQDQGDAVHNLHNETSSKDSVDYLSSNGCIYAKGIKEKRIFFTELIDGDNCNTKQTYV